MSESADSCSFTTRTNTLLLEGLKRPENSGVWSEFVARYRPVLIGYARRLGLRDADAEDVAQATLEAFHVCYSRGDYDRTRGRLRDWLFGIARNQIRLWHRSRRRHEAQVGSDDDLLATISDERSMERAWDDEWQAELLRVCLEEIRREVDARTLSAFELFAHQGMPAQRVAEQLGMSTNAVFIAKHRILKRIRELLPQLEKIW